MSTAPKIAQRLANPGSFHVEQQQRLAQDTARKVNSFVDTINALTNRSYAALAADTTVGVAAYATILTAPITTVLASSYLIITFSVSGTHITNAGTNFFQVLVDGAVVKGCYATVSLTFSFTTSMVVRKAVTRGAHTVQLQWKTNTASMVVNAATVVEDHAHLLVQEAA